MKSGIRNLFVCIVLSVSVAACEKAEFNGKQLIGRWVVSEGPKDLQLDGHQPSPVLVLRGAGRFEGSDLPRIIFFPSSPSNSVTVAGNGRWRLGDAEDGQRVIDLVFENGENMKGNFPYGLRLFLTTNHGSPVLTYYHGDPDTDTRLDFEKEPEEK